MAAVPAQPAPYTQVSLFPGRQPSVHDCSSALHSTDEEAAAAVAAAAAAAAQDQGTAAVEVGQEQEGTGLTALQSTDKEDPQFPAVLKAGLTALPQE